MPSFQYYRELTALRHIKRFQQNACVRPISVAEHSFYVGIIAYQYADELCKRGIEVDRNAACVAGMHHDLEEALTTDLPHQIKRSSDGLYDAWELLEARVQGMLGLIMAMPQMPAKNTLLDLVVRVADWTELVLYVCEERLMGNRAIDVPAETILKALEKINPDDYTVGMTEQRYCLVGGWLRDTVASLIGAYSGGLAVYGHRPLTFGGFGKWGA